MIPRQLDHIDLCMNQARDGIIDADRYLSRDAEGFDAFRAIVGAARILRKTDHLSEEQANGIILKVIYTACEQEGITRQEVLDYGTTMRRLRTELEELEAAV